MITRSFEAFGTAWTLLIDHPHFPDSILETILQATDQFEQHYSRFIETSEVCQFRQLPPGKYPVSDPLAELLQSGQVLQTLTNGGFNIAVGTLLEQAGYDANYSLAQAPEHTALHWHAPTWSIQGNVVTLSEPLVFDIGGIGKGYWIDQISQILKQHDFPYHLIDGGGDMFATQKSSGEGWKVAIEWPGREDTALSLISLFHQGLAISDIYKRRWKDWNHLIHATTMRPLSALLGCAAIASSAYHADQITSGIAFSHPKNHQAIVDHFSGIALVVNADQAVAVYNQWPGERYF